ncbi:MAG TPA: hypothetical protein VK843_01920 [Planctomycetota bacterium]|nr:hypothetical protein [Planctomycetota bacterium]
MTKDARDQHDEAVSASDEAKSAIRKHKDRLGKLERSIFRRWRSQAIEATRELLHEATCDLTAAESRLVASMIETEFNLGAKQLAAYGMVVRAYEDLSRCSVAWDITGTAVVDRVATRSIASTAVVRKRIHLDFHPDPVLRTRFRIPRFQNANGEDILLFPGLLLADNRQGNFALIALADVIIKSETTTFVEAESVPADAEVAGSTWLKTNKDGSPDRRFAKNRQLPLCSYAELWFTSSTGLREAFMFSSRQKTQAFAEAVRELVRVIESGDVD